MAHGPDFLISPSARLVAGRDNPISIGSDVHIADDACLVGPVVVGDHVYIGYETMLRPNTVIGSEIAIGPRVHILSETHDVMGSGRRAGPTLTLGAVVGDGCWIGANAVICPGVRIGAGCVIAAGAVVTKDTPPNTLVAGVPGRVIRELEP